MLSWFFLKGYNLLTIGGKISQLMLPECSLPDTGKSNADFFLVVFATISFQSMVQRASNMLKYIQI